MQRGGDLRTGHQCNKCEGGCHFGNGRVRLLDRDRRIIWANVETHGVSLSKLIGARLEEIGCELDREMMRTQADRVFRNGVTVELLARDRFALKWWWLYIAPAMTVGGNAAAVMEVQSVCGRFFEITPTQRKLLFRLTQGKSVTRVARHYGVSINTVRTQLSRARDTLQVDDMSGVLEWAGLHRHLLAKYKGSQVL